MGIFVFEANKLPFDNINEDAAAPALALLRQLLQSSKPKHNTASTTMMATIAGEKKEDTTNIVAVPPAQNILPPPATTTIPTATTTTTGSSTTIATLNKNHAEEGEGDALVVAEIKKEFSLWERTLLVAVWQVMAPYREQQQQQQQQQLKEKKKQQGTKEEGEEEARLLQQQVELAVKIVRGLDELESVYEGAKNTYYDEDAEGYLAPPPTTANANTATAECEAVITESRRAELEEEAIMNAIFQERFGIPFPPPTANTEETATTIKTTTVRGRDKVEIDVAICFNERGDSVGVGSAAVFGGQGYHP